MLIFAELNITFLYLAVYDIILAPQLIVFLRSRLIKNDTLNAKIECINLKKCHEKPKQINCTYNCSFNY